MVSEKKTNIARTKLQLKQHQLKQRGSLNGDPVGCCCRRSVPIFRGDIAIESTGSSGKWTWNRSAPKSTYSNIGVAYEQTQTKSSRIIEWPRESSAVASAPQADLRRANKRPLVAAALLLLSVSWLLLSLSRQVEASHRPLVSAQRRVLRQTSENVPYQSFYVTRACEWKSNLFVPKSNDIHFAQSSQLPAAVSALDSQQQQQHESSVAYESFSQPTSSGSNYQLSQTSGRTAQQDGSRTMLSTDSKALILALPISIAHSFNGYEPACSIRLIVPRNMRILAKITSRRLTFAQQQLRADAAGNLQQNLELWLNVSQNQFIETEHKTIETEGNVLAFRFLLERFANKQLPDTRFQVVLTAFQTLSDNSDLNGAGLQWQQPQQPYLAANQEQQFICDQQRLISANLACDGFKNCQDGHDEDLATCLAVRNLVGAAGAPKSSGGANPTPTGNKIDPQSEVSDATSDERSPVQRPPLWTRVWQFGRETGSLAGFLLGFLLVLVLLCCCACCGFAGWRWCHARRRGERAGPAARREAAQNSENAARLKRAMLSQPESKPSPLQVPTRLQSILKKPGPLPEPLFGQRPAEPPPEAPVGRGALSSSLRNSGRKPEFRPTPARRLTRPTRPVPAPEVTPTQRESAAGPGVTDGANTRQRVSTYHFSSGSTSLSPAYIQRLAEQAPSRGAQVNYQESSKSPTQSSLI